MGAIVVLGEVVVRADGSVTVAKSSLCALAAAAEFAATRGGAPVHVLVVGASANQHAALFQRYSAQTIHWFDDGAVSTYRALPYATVVSAAMDLIGADTFVCAASSTGKDLAPCVAALRDAGQASDIVAVHPDGTFRRPMYAGDLLADVEIVTEQKVITVRASAFAPAVEVTDSAPIERLSIAAPIPSLGEVVNHELSASARPELSSAAVVVSGGRAVGSAEQFEKVVFPLADVLGAAVGASRAAVDSGYAPNDWQVGQTGKVVAPNLYVAVGISGAIQHLAGMKDSKTIVAINKDPEAPIFEVATYGLVADLFEAIPALTEAIRQVKG
jgi:electron transfer flavoprotein alpha subunit